jgi:hypothetical protein
MKSQVQPDFSENFLTRGVLNNKFNVNHTPHCSCNTQ